MANCNRLIGWVIVSNPAILLKPRLFSHVNLICFIGADRGKIDQNSCIFIMHPNYRYLVLKNPMGVY